MANLVAPKNNPSPSEDDDGAPSNLFGLIERLLGKEAARRFRNMSDDQLTLLIHSLLQARSKQRRPPVGLPPGETTKVPFQPGDRIEVAGHILPGAQVGSGVTINRGGVAGGDHVTNQAPGGTVIYKPGHVTITPSPKARSDEQTGPLDRLERNYLMRLLVNAGSIPLGQLNLGTVGADGSTPEIRLDAVYVPLDTLRTQPAIQRTGSEGRYAPVPVLASAIANRLLVILGDPGSGKTTFLNYLTLCLAGARLYPDQGYLERLNVPPQDGQRSAKWRYGPLVPLRISLSKLAYDIPTDTQSGTAQMVRSHIDHTLADWGLAEFSPCIKEALLAGQCLVMFDGLDEVYHPNLRRLVRQALDDFVHSYADNRYIVTCRVLSYTNPEWQLPSFPAVTLAPLSQQAIDAFIANWYAALARQGYLDPEAAKAKTLALRSAAHALHDLAQNPMLLTVMAVVHTYRGTLPRERARLYDECINLLLWDWQRAKQTEGGRWEPGILEELGTREGELVNALCEVAFNAHRAQGSGPGTAHIPQRDILSTLQAYLGGDWGKAQRFCQYVETRAGLLIGKGEDRQHGPLYAFPHRGFQEFLAGRHLVAGWDFARRVAELAAQGDFWHEVLLLAVGHLVYNAHEKPRPLDAINLLCKPALPVADEEWRQVWWAAEMLLIVGREAAEQDAYLGRDLVPRVIHHLTALVQGGHLTPIERAQAADVLGLLGDPRPGVCSLEPDMVRLEGGLYPMGGLAHRVRIGPFYLSRYPVTNAQFRVFARDGYNDDRYWTPEGIAWRKRAGGRGGLINDPTWGIDNRPVVAVTWFEAVAYANWLRAVRGKPYRLPTEAEWEYAAAGLEGRKYPWGHRTHDDTANIREAGVGSTTAVGIFPQDRTPEGIYDLGGNVWEWCSSLDRPGLYQASDGREDLNAAGARVLRGGAYDSPRRLIHATQRHPVEPHERVKLIGFRLAMDAS